MDGFETARHIKRRERTRHVPIIFLTAADRDSHLALRGYAAGAVDYLTKPFDPWVLRAKVSVFVELWTKTQQLQAQTEAVRQREQQIRAVGTAIDEATAALKAALAADGELGRDQIEKAKAALAEGRSRI
jgi:DNA-binding response OmpR family regulator